MASFALHAGTLKIEENEVLKSVLAEMKTLGSSPEVYPFSEKYRLDLSLIDIVDQGSVVAQNYAGLNERLKKALYPTLEIFDFAAWFKELKKSADENPKLKIQLDKTLYVQFYSPKGVALLSEYKYIDLQKIKDNGKLARIREYNYFADDPEATGILATFEKAEWKVFYTKKLTVAKLKEIKLKDLKQLHKRYYKTLIDLYVKHDPNTSFKRVKHGIKAYQNIELNDDSKKLFNIIHKLPNKHQVLFSLAQHVKDIPYDQGFIILTPTFIQSHQDKIVEALKEITLDQIIHSDDDRYLLTVRKYIQDHIQTVESDLAAYNQTHGTDLKLIYAKRDQKPRRLEAMANIEMLTTLYPDAPWLKKNRGVIFNHKGKEIYLENKVGHFFAKLGHELIQPETYLSILAGSATLILTEGNVPIAMSTQKIVKRAIETKRYDKEWDEFLKEAPKDVIDALLMGSGMGAGRFYKIVALGAGQGFLQSLFTGQDLRTGALVGAGLNIVQFYILPSSFSRPITKGFDAKSLAMNRRLELLEKTVKGAIQGSTVALVDGQDIGKAAIKGSAYGLVSSQLLIWFMGARYNPFRDFSDADVDKMIELENEYQNAVGRGGNYAINRQLIMDANFRIGGVLPKMINATITLPGNVSMFSRHFDQLSTLTHEAHHLMQQQQSGVFGFYLFRYIPTSFRTGYDGHPDENFLRDVIGNF